MEDCADLNRQRCPHSGFAEGTGWGHRKTQKQVHRYTQDQAAVFMETSSRLEGTEAPPETLGGPRCDHLPVRPQPRARRE